MSDKTNIAAQSAQTPESTTPKQSSPKADTQSVMSTTSTLNDAKGSSKQTDAKKAQGLKLSDSSTAFAKKAKEQGWGAPTATRPSFGG